MSNHPTLTTEQAKDFARTMMVRADLTQEDVDEFLRGRHVEPGEIDLNGVQAVADLLDQRLEREAGHDRSLEDLEAEFATPVFDAIRVLPLEALGDVGFWSYLSVRFFWNFIQRRQRSSLPFGKSEKARAAESADEGPEKLPVARYLIGKDHYQIPLRLFLRAQAVDRGDDFIAKHPVGKGTDFWRSHVLGVRTSAYPAWARAVVAAQSKAGLSSEDARESAKRINRIRANVSMPLHEDAEATAIVDPLWRAD